MKTGIELIAQERKEQVEKHGYSKNHDKEVNKGSQLSFASSLLNAPVPEFFASPANNYGCPTGWDVKKWKKILDKPYMERLIISGALIAAEIDRLQAIEKTK